jgi:hypothetical protein
MTAPRCTTRPAANSTEPKSAAATASASDPPSASQVTGPITSDRVPSPAVQHRQGDTSPVVASAELCGEVCQSGEGQQPAGDADGQLGRRADLPIGGVDHDQGGFEQAGGDGEQPQPEGDEERGGDARPGIRRRRVDPRRMCILAYHDDATSDGMGGTTTTPRSGPTRPAWYSRPVAMTG